jgi:hypothetical protein
MTGVTLFRGGKVSEGLTGRGAGIRLEVNREPQGGRIRARPVAWCNSLGAAIALRLAGAQ